MQHRFSGGERARRRGSVGAHLGTVWGTSSAPQHAKPITVFKSKPSRRAARMDHHTKLCALPPQSASGSELAAFSASRRCTCLSRPWLLRLLQKLTRFSGEKHEMAVDGDLTTAQLRGCWILTAHCQASRRCTEPSIPHHQTLTRLWK